MTPHLCIGGMPYKILRIGFLKGAQGQGEGVTRYPRHLTLLEIIEVPPIQPWTVMVLSSLLEFIMAPQFGNQFRAQHMSHTKKGELLGRRHM